MPSHPARHEAGDRRYESDYRLVQAALRREQAAVDDLVERMHCVPRIVAVRNQRLGSPIRPNELGDLVQDCLEVIWRKLPTYAGHAKLETWVFSCCYLQFFKRLRSDRRFPNLFEDAPDRSLDTIVDREDIELGRSLEFERLYSGLEELDASEVELVRLKHFDGLSFTAIAERQRLPVSTVKTRYYQAVFRLRRRLKGRADASKAEEVR